MEGFWPITFLRDMVPRSNPGPNERSRQDKSKYGMVHGGTRNGCATFLPYKLEEFMLLLPRPITLTRPRNYCYLVENHPNPIVNRVSYLEILISKLLSP